MAKVSELFDFPLSITSEEFDRFSGRNLEIEIDGDNAFRVENFLNTIHSHIYDFLIYNTGSKVIKDRIIDMYKQELEKPLKRALVLQGKYLLENDNIGLWNGTVHSVNGTDIKDMQDIVQRIICPEVINLLLGTQPNILYAGG